MLVLNVLRTKTGKSMPIIDGDYAHGAPNLVVEILSKSNRKYDEEVKLSLYQQFAVDEYWIVDPFHDTVKMYRLAQGVYTLTADLKAERDDEIVSPLLTGFGYLLASLFKD